MTKSEAKLAHSWQFDALGTKWEIVCSREIPEALQKNILNEIDAFDRVYSRFRTDSLVGKLASDGGSALFPESAREIFAFYEALFELTEGKVTPLVGDVLVSAGYDKDYTLTVQSTPLPAARYDEIVKRAGAVISVLRPTHIDIGAAGKGYLVDRIAQQLLDHTHDTFVIDASGDIRVVGEHTEHIGLENPLSSDEAIGMVSLSNQSLCASAINRRQCGDWHHVIDPESGTPTDEVVATWVMADSTMIADGLATALFFTSPNRLATRYNYEYLRMMRDGSVECSKYFREGLFT